MKNFFAFGFLFVSFYTSRAQMVEDTIVVYNLLNNSKSLLLPAALPSSSNSAHSAFSYGTYQTTQTLPSVTPQSNLFPNTQFTKLSKANNFFDVSTFPARTAVKIVCYINGNKGSMTGMLVGDCMVLTAGHIIYNSGASPVGNFTFDSIRVLPAYDMGSQLGGFVSAKVEKMYLFKHYITNLKGDIALLQLSQPLGTRYGYTGIGFEADLNNLPNNLYHKFSYPSAVDPSDSTIVYNGDTLYYNYGKITDQSPWLGLGGGWGIPGQSGSTFLHFDGSDYFNIGSFSYSTNYLHYRITRSAYYQLTNVIQNATCPANTLSAETLTADNIAFEVSPNPSRTGFIIHLKSDAPGNKTVYLTDYSGALVFKIKSSEASIFVPRNNLPAGIYFASLRFENGNFQVSKVVFE